MSHAGKTVSIVIRPTIYQIASNYTCVMPQKFASQPRARVWPQTDPETLFQACGLAQRCDVVEGDFFEAIPSGHQAYILSHVLHDWEDEQCVAILRNCRKAIAPDGRLLIVEAVLPLGDVPHHGKMMDLLMLTVTGGRERTAAEFSDLLGAAQFRINRL